MTKMRQIANIKLPRPRQTTANTLDVAQASPDIMTDPMTSSIHLNSPVCLPLVSESKQLLWVDGHQINLQLDEEAELNKAFDKFPYLTHRQSVELAQRCSLHPDQVKVWFMAERLRYGISWDFKDIREMWSKFRFSQGDAEVTKEQPKEMKEGFTDDRGNKKKEKERKKKGKEQSAKETKTIEGNVTTNKKTNTEQEQPMVQEKNRNVEERKINTPRKRNRVAVTGKRKRKKVDDNEGIIEGAAKAEAKSVEGGHREPICAMPEGASCTKKRKRAKKRLNIQESHALDNPFGLDIPLDINALLIIKPQSQTNTILLNENQTDLLDRADGPHNTPNIPTISVNSTLEWKRELDNGLGGDPQTEPIVLDAGELKEIARVDNSLLVANDPLTITQSQDDHDIRPLRSYCYVKTEGQLELLRMAFMNCQYPNSEYYKHLEVLTGIPRHVLVQWFGDTRYYIKKSRPRWMSEEQHKRALATVRYNQCMKALVKEHQNTNDVCTTKMMAFERSRSYEDGKSVKE